MKQATNNTPVKIGSIKQRTTFSDWGLLLGLPILIGGQGTLVLDSGVTGFILIFILVVGIVSLVIGPERW